MKLSELIERAEMLKYCFGDVDLLDKDDFVISGLEINTATKGQKEFWGIPPPEEDYLFVRVVSSD